MILEEEDRVREVKVGQMTVITHIDVELQVLEFNGLNIFTKM